MMLLVHVEGTREPLHLMLHQGRRHLDPACMCSTSTLCPLCSGPPASPQGPAATDPQRTSNQSMQVLTACSEWCAIMLPCCIGPSCLQCPGHRAGCLQARQVGSTEEVVVLQYEAAAAWPPLDAVRLEVPEGDVHDGGAAGRPHVHLTVAAHNGQAVALWRPAHVLDMALVHEHSAQLHGAHVPHPHRVGHVLVDSGQVLAVTAPAQLTHSYLGAGFVH
mmetsp:Transcript_6193/g.13488  ORF Transcript_6193/g.13488 Transcript_6193/m.13488 type:complete len:219 (-) Transcript_6193:1145-1801(-)